jgi:hypothetical protein
VIAADMACKAAPHPTSGRTWNGASELNAPIIVPYVMGSTPTSALLISATNAVDPADSTYFDFPLWVGFLNSAAAAITPGGAQFKGIVPDFALGPSQCAQGSVDGAPGSITSMFLGNLWFPSNAAPSL